MDNDLVCDLLHKMRKNYTSRFSKNITFFLNTWGHWRLDMMMIHQPHSHNGWPDMTWHTICHQWTFNPNSQWLTWDNWKHHLSTIQHRTLEPHSPEIHPAPRMSVIWRAKISPGCPNPSSTRHQHSHLFCVKIWTILAKNWQSYANLSETSWYCYK